MMHLQVFLGHSGGVDAAGNHLPRLVYVSREKRVGHNHHKKAGAMNACASCYSYIPLRCSLLLSLSCERTVLRFLLLNRAGVRVSVVLTNAPYILNLDCDHYINNSKALKERPCIS